MASNAKPARSAAPAQSTWGGWCPRCGWRSATRWRRPRPPRVGSGGPGAGPPPRRRRPPPPVGRRPRRAATAGGPAPRDQREGHQRLLGAPVRAERHLHHVRSGQRLRRLHPPQRAGRGQPLLVRRDALQRELLVGPERGGLPLRLRRLAAVAQDPRRGVLGVRRAAVPSIPSIRGGALRLGDDVEGERLTRHRRLQEGARLADAAQPELHLPVGRLHHLGVDAHEDQPLRQLLPRRLSAALRRVEDHAHAVLSRVVARGRFHLPRHPHAHHHQQDDASGDEEPGAV